MLVKLLNQKSKFLKYGLPILFLFAFYTTLPKLNTDLEQFFSYGLFLLTCIILGIYFYGQNLTRNSNLGLFILFSWIIVFYKGASSLEISGTFLLTNLLLIGMLLFDSNQQFKFKALDLSLLLVVAIITYPPNAIFLLFIAPFLLLTKTIYPKKGILFITGLVIFSFLFIQLMYLDNNFEFTIDYIVSKITEYNFRIPTFNEFLLSPIILIVIIGMVDFYNKYLGRQSAFKQPYFIQTIFFLTWLGLYIVYDKELLLVCLALPLATIITRLINFTPKVWLKNLIFSVYIFSLLFYSLEKFYSDLSF